MKLSSKPWIPALIFLHSTKVGYVATNFESLSPVSGIEIVSLSSLKSHERASYNTVRCTVPHDYNPKTKDKPSGSHSLYIWPLCIFLLTLTSWSAELIPSTWVLCLRGIFLAFDSLYDIRLEEEHNGRHSVKLKAQYDVYVRELTIESWHRDLIMYVLCRI